MHKKVCVPPTASRKEKKKTGKKKERPNLCAATAGEVRAAHARHKEREKAKTKGGLTAHHFEGMRDLDEELGLHSLMRDVRVADPRKQENRMRKAETREKDRTGVQLGVADDECPICLEAFGNHKCTTLPCGHVLHSHCFKNMRDQTEWCCPLCRRTYHADFLTCDQPSSVSLVDMWNGTHVDVPEHETSSRSGIMRFKNRKAVTVVFASCGLIFALYSSSCDLVRCVLASLRVLAAVVAQGLKKPQWNTGGRLGCVWSLLLLCYFNSCSDRDLVHRSA